MKKLFLATLLVLCLSMVRLTVAAGVLTYTITYELDGGTNASSNPTSYQFTSQFRLFDATKTGYTFLGWYDNLEFDGTAITAIVSGTSGDLTFYAKWEVNTYSITYVVVPEDYVSSAQMLLLPGETISSIATGVYITSAITSLGRLFVWGYNVYGSVGDGTSGLRLVPTDVSSYLGLTIDEKVVQVAHGLWNTIALTSEGRVFTWGNNDYGQIGDGTTTNRYTPTEITGFFCLDPDEKVVQVTSGSFHEAVRTSSNRVFAWGNNMAGQVGTDSMVNQPLPVDITARFALAADETVDQLVLGSHHSMLLTSTGRVFTWGRNDYNQLGDGTGTSRLVPTEITARFGLSGDEVVSTLESGGGHSAALTSGGRLFTWGFNSYGEVGNGTTTNVSSPIDITNEFDLAPGETLTGVTFGEYHSLVQTSAGRFFLWGWNDDGQLGDGTTTSRTLPVDATADLGLEDGESTDRIALGVNYSTMLTSTGRFLVWGGNNMGQLGDGTTTSQPVPTAFESESLPNMETVSFSYQSQTEALSPEREGYTVTAWYNDPELTSRYSFSTMPARNLILYGTWTLETYWINYVLNGAFGQGDNPWSYTMASPTIVLQPTMRAGCTFDGWYDNADFTGDAVTTIPTGSTGLIVLYAKWTLNSYTITFDADGGSEVAPITQAYGTAITAPADPTREGYRFDGWSSAVPATMPGWDAVLTARWVLNQHTITFDADGGSAVDGIWQDYGSSIYAPTNPTREGYTFAGWSPALPETMPDEDLTLTASWTINSYTITFDANGGSDVAAITQDFGTEVVAPENPTREGYRFNGWTPSIPAVMPVDGLTLHARWLSLVVQSTSDVLTGADGVLDALDPALFQDKDVEVVLAVHGILPEDLSPADAALFLAALQAEQHAVYLDVTLTLSAVDEEDLLLSELDRMITLTIAIPASAQGYTGYRVVRLSDGVVETLDSVYDETNQTLSFATDRLTAYAIVYDVPVQEVAGAAWGWWFLLLLVPLGYVGYRYRKEVAGLLKGKAAKKA